MKKNVVFALIIIIAVIIVISLVWKPLTQLSLSTPSIQPIIQPTQVDATAQSTPPLSSEEPALQSVIQIPLSGSAAENDAEISGLAWYGDNLVLLPQYPHKFSDGEYGILFYLPKSEIITLLDQDNQAVLSPRPIDLIADDLEKMVTEYQGFEAIEFYQEQVFLTIESGEGENMMGHIIKGEITPDLSAMTLDTTKIVDIPPQAKSANHSDESILIMDDKVITFYEVLGEAIVADPVAHAFDHDLNPIGTIPMDNIEYRLTDTTLAGEDEFWGINYFFPGDEDLATPSDPISEKYGTGHSNNDQQQIERLVKFEYSQAGIHLMDESPVYLMLDEEIRNWEGLVMLDERGFLLATDKYPTTILAFIAAP